MWFFPRLRSDKTDLHQAEQALEEARKAHDEVARRKPFIECLTREIDTFVAENHFSEQLQGVIISHLGKAPRES